jgi:hypothetical protein
LKRGKEHDMKSISLRAGLAGAATAIALAGCGGGGGDGTPAEEFAGGSEVPLAATQSAAEATRFVRSTGANSSDSAEPLRVGDATLATSETAEPEPL